MHIGAIALEQVGRERGTGGHIQPVHFTGFVRQQRGFGLGDDFLEDGAVAHRVAVPVLVVSDQQQVLLEAVPLQDVSAIGDEANGVGPVLRIDFEHAGFGIDCGDRVEGCTVIGDERDEGAQFKEVRRGPMQGDDEGVFIRGFDTDGFGESLPGLFPQLLWGLARGVLVVSRQLVSAPPEEILGALDVIEQHRVVGGHVGQQRAAPGVDEVFGGDRIAVAPSGVGADLERVGQAVIADRPGFGDAGLDSQILRIVDKKRFVKAAGDTPVHQPTDFLRIEALVRVGRDEYQVRLVLDRCAGFAAVSAARHRSDENQNNGTAIYARHATAQVRLVAWWAGPA